MVENGCRILHGLKPIILMVLCQMASGGVNIFYKLAIADGMKIRIMIFYRFVFAAIFMVPFAFVVERDRRPKLTWKICFQGFMSALLGAALGSSLFAESLALTSATYATAIANLMPAATLVLALIFRQERLNITTSAGQAKLIGTVLGISGAMLLSLYKGIEIKMHVINLEDHYKTPQASKLVHGKHVLGITLAICSCLSYAGWLIIQTKMSKSYPYYSSTAMMCLAGAIQTGIYAMCTEQNWSAWRVGWDIKLATVAYAGIVSSGLAVTVATWCTSIKGPLYVASFYPLALVFVAIVGSLILDEKLYLGSILGSVLIVAGLYIVLWGKGQDRQLAESTTLKSSADGVLDTISISDGNRSAKVIVPTNSDDLTSDAASASNIKPSTST